MATLWDFDLDGANPRYEDELEKAARAVIQTLRKPTKAMYDNAMPYMDSWSSNTTWWEKMIDGAVK